MRQYAWVITSDHPVTDIEINIPGVAFVDFDADLGRDPEVSVSAASDVDSPATPQTPPSDSFNRDIARVIVTSDSEELLDGLVVEPVVIGSASRALRVRVKNADTELKGSVMTQVYVNTKNAVRHIDNATATTVIRDNILVHDDAAAEMTLCARNSGKLIVWTDNGFYLGSLTAATKNDAMLEISTPFIVAQNLIGISSWWNGGSVDVVADTIAAKEVNALAIKSGDVVLHTAKLAADKCFTGAAISAAARISGNGTAREHTAMAFWSSSVSSPGIVAAKTEAFVGLTGCVLAHPVQHLEVHSIGAGSVGYVGAEPEIVRTDSWMPWLSRQQSSAEPAVKPATPTMLADAAKPRQLQDTPLREPVAFHMRVKKSRTPELQNLEGSSYRAKLIADALPTIGVLAVGALGVLNLRRHRPARLA